MDGADCERSSYKEQTNPPTEMKARREKNLCYNCDKKWVRGHRCKGKLFRLSEEGDVLTEVVDDCLEE